MQMIGKNLGVIVITLFISLFFFTSCTSASRLAEPYEKITWQTSYEKDDYLYIPGSVTADFGTFNFMWKIGHNNSCQLITLQNFGAGELPPIEEKLYLLYNENGTTTIFSEIPSLYNSSEPAKLKKIVTVRTRDLKISPKQNTCSVVSGDEQL